jgi:uncharacterized protein
MDRSTKPHLLGLLAGLFLAAGLVASTLLATRAWLKIAETQNIVVTGSARRMVKSDLIVWQGSFSAEAGTLLESQRKLKADAEKVRGFLHASGITNEIFTSISIQEVQATQRDDHGLTQQKTVGYRLTQTVEVRSTDVERTIELERQSTALVEQGVLFTPAPPQFIYTKASEAKVEMLAEATKDARARAMQIATQGGRSIHALREARMGVFQITPLHSSETSAEGINDTTSLEKTILSVVSATFSLK